MFCYDLDPPTDMQRNCMMGLFLEISRAWLAIDSDIFVWNYEDRWAEPWYKMVN